MSKKSSQIKLRLKCIQKKTPNSPTIDEKRQALKMLNDEFSEQKSITEAETMSILTENEFDIDSDTEIYCSYCENKINMWKEQMIELSEQNLKTKKIKVQYYCDDDCLLNQYLFLKGIIKEFFVLKKIDSDQKQDEKI